MSDLTKSFVFKVRVFFRFKYCCIIEGRLVSYVQW